MLIKTDRDTILDYLEDSSGIKGGFVDEVVFPESERELISFLKELGIKKTPVTISGGKTGVTGGAVPFGGVLISTESLNRKLEVCKDKGIAKVSCNVRLKEIEEAALKEGFMYPVDPTEKDAFIGGNIATNASGAKSFRFGSTRDYVTSLRAVLADGDMLWIKRGEHICNRGNTFCISTQAGRSLNFKLPSYKMPAIKNAAGYFVKEKMDLIDLFIGQEGTLGIIIEAEIRLIKSPKNIIGILSFFESEEGSLSFSDRLRELSHGELHEKDITPISIEFFDMRSIEMLRQEYKHIPPNASAAIFFELMIDKDADYDMLGRYERMLKDFSSDIDKSWCGMDAKTKERLREFRHKLPVLVNEQVKRNGFPKVGTDIAVPKEYFRIMYSFYKDSLENFGISYVIFGHIGDCHLHLNLLPKNEEEFLRAKELYLKFIDKAVSLGGTISAEHGIGKLKHAYLERMYSKEHVLQMARLKKVFDQNCILNMDNIFPKEYLKQV
jgi:D-lactate dehydrogenase (cytochrome)